MIALIKQTGTTQTMNYMHRDQLGSTTTITDESGIVIERLAYEPFGKRRQAGGATDSEGTVVGINTDRGFTNHEHLEELGLIHMNGRVYDPALGRFMSADPYIQAPDNIQSYNRYAYVTNRPLGLTDPSGYLFGGVLRVPFIDNAWNNHVKPLARPLLSVAAAIGCTALSQGSAAAACIGIAQTGISKAYGANWGDAIKNGVIAGASTYAFQQINASNFGKIGTIAASAGVGCVSAAAAGGNCQAGALAAGFSAAYDRFIGFSKEGTYAVLQNMVVGGTASVLGGGKFQNGAVTAAFRYVIQQGYLRDHDLGRSLAANEIAEVRGTFGDSIDVSKVRIFSTQWMALQGERTAMTPDGNIYFPLASSCEDLTLCANGYYRDVFMHEMGHVMQHQSGVNVVAEALPQQIMYGISFGHYNPYLSAEQYRNISDPSKLNVESQADWYKFRSNDLRYR